MNARQVGTTHPTRLSLILPAYNEVDVIERTIAEAQSYFRKRGISYELIVSADGDDGTRELIAGLARTDPSLSAIGGNSRRGKGYAIRQAVPLTNGQIVGFVDADGKTPISELDKVFPWFERDYDLVIGSRAMPDSMVERRQPWYRQIGSWGFGIAMHTIVGLQSIPDTQCGFKFFQRAVAVNLFRRQVVDGYMFDVEILYLAMQMNYRLAQVGVRWRDDRDSRLNLVRGNARNAIDLLRIPWNGRRAGEDETVQVPPGANDGGELQSLPGGEAR